MTAGKLRIALPRISFAGSGEGGSLTAVYVVYTLVLFFVFLLVNFPFDMIVQQVLQSVSTSALRVEAAGARFAFLRGVEVRNVRAVNPSNPEAPPLFEARALYVKPNWSRLLRGDYRSLSFYGIAYNGIIEGDLRVGADLSRLKIEFDSLNLARYAPLTTALGNGELNGLLSGSIEADTKGAAIDAAQASAVIHLDDVSARAVPLVGTVTAPELSGCAGAMSLQLAGGKVEIQESTLECDQIKFNGTGTIQPRSRPEDSVVNLKYQMQPGAKPIKEWDLVATVIGCGASGTLGKIKPQPCPKAAAAAPPKPAKK